MTVPNTMLVTGYNSVTNINLADFEPKKAYENEPLMSFDIQPYWWYRDTTENLLPDENSDEYDFRDRKLLSPSWFFESIG